MFKNGFQKESKEKRPGSGGTKVEGIAELEFRKEERR